MALALENIKVLDLTRVLAGPYATMVLGDLGADVLKVEMPVTGDDSRHFGPYQNGESAYFMSINRNKRSITLNLKTEEGKEILRKLIKESDVIVENFRPGTMEKLGLGYDVIKEINPRIIYAASSGFGHTGPYSPRPAYDAIVQAMGGIMSITGQPGSKPTRVGTSMGDITAGLFAAIGILAALNSRNETGKGQKVDVAMLDSQIAILENAIARYVVSGEVPKYNGNRHPSIVPFEDFETANGVIMIAVGNDALWKKFCPLAGLGHLLEDSRFEKNVGRDELYEELRPMIADALLKKTTEEWQEIFDKEGIPNGPINTIDMVLEDPQVIAREMIVEVEHPVAGHLRMPGIPIKLSETPGQIKSPSPLLGEHTEDVLGRLGYSAEEIEKLREEKVI